MQARYASLEAEYGGTHLTAGEGRELHTYLSETLQHAVSSLPTPSASEASYSGNTENEDCLYGAAGDSEQESDCGQPWMGKFGEQQMYIDVVSQNLNGLVDQQARFLHLLAELVTCQVSVPVLPTALPHASALISVARVNSCDTYCTRCQEQTLSLVLLIACCRISCPFPLTR